MLREVLPNPRHLGDRRRKLGDFPFLTLVHVKIRKNLHPHVPAHVLVIVELNLEKEAVLVLLSAGSSFSSDSSFSLIGWGGAR